jgi:hypothetical protein
MISLNFPSGETLRRKWKNKRDAYKKNRRRLQQKRSGAAATPVHNIEFFEQLSFLDSYIADRRYDS